MITKIIKDDENNAPKTKGRPKAFSRHEALEKAMLVFCEKGYEATSISQLSTAMNMNPPSIYNAFGDKEKLFIEVLEFYHAPYVETVEQIFNEQSDTTTAITKLLKLSKEQHTHSYSGGCLIVNSSINVKEEESPIATKIKQLHTKNETIIYNRLKKGQQIGDISSKANLHSLSRFINGVLQGAAILARGQQSPEAVKDLIDISNNHILTLLME